MKRPRFLCVCENGNNRSVFLAYRLKRHGYEALACGWRSSSPETFNMLCDWADHIVVMQAGFELKIPDTYKWKTKIMDVGMDKWGPRWHSEMKQIVYKAFDNLMLEVT